MTTTAPGVTAPAEVDPLAGEFAATLHRIADSIAAGELARPRGKFRLYLTSLTVDRADGKAAFVGARRAFPDATVEVSEHYVELHVGPQAVLLFDKASLGAQTTVTRPVVEYVLDPDLLALVTQ